MTEMAISVRGLCKEFGGKAVVKDVSIDVPRGQIFGFLGPNGSGKTTTIRLLCGLLTPDAGTGTCLGLDIVKDTAKVKRQVGYMTQKFSLYEDLTIRENLEFVGRVYEIANPAQSATDALVRLGLETRQHQLAGTLSGGWKQRLALAACMLHDPKLLLLDEPTAGVDPKARRDFWDEIHKLAANGLTVLVSTHYMDEAERCHEIGYIAYGRLLIHGTVDKVIANSGLTTFQISGADLSGIAAGLAAQSPDLMVAPFGTTLHVSARSTALLDTALAPLRQRASLQIDPLPPSLEDVFIHMMRQSQDNFG